MNYTTIPSDETIQNTLEALKNNGINAYLVETAEQALEKIKELVPEQSEVFAMTSVTLDSTGISKLINESGKYDSVRNQLNSLDKSTQGREMRKLGAAPDFALGSVHAITSDGKLLIASNTGSQLPAYVYGAGKVIWVAGAQKIVTDEAEGVKRVYEYVLPLESDRAHKAYGVEGSYVSKLLQIYKEVNPERAHIIIVKQNLGF